MSVRNYADLSDQATYYIYRVYFRGAGDAFTPPCMGLICHPPLGNWLTLYLYGVAPPPLDLDLPPPLEICHYAFVPS